MKVYLAGPINGCDDDAANNWRERAEATLVRHGATVINPMDRDERGKEASAFADIVEGDKADINRADTLLAFCWQPSVGTSMEILYASDRNKRVLVVIPPRRAVSPWIRYHATAVYHDLAEALWALVGDR